MAMKSENKNLLVGLDIGTSKVVAVVADLALYRGQPAMHQLDCDAQGFEWVDCCDWESSTVSLIRKAKDPNDLILAVCNFTPVPRNDYKVGVPRGGHWDEILNSDAELYGGSGVGNYGGRDAEAVPHHGREYRLTVTLPPLGIVLFKPHR